MKGLVSTIDIRGHDQSELIVVFFCKEYEKKEWCCNVEWRAIRDLIKTRRERSVFPLKFDNADLSEVYSIDIIPDISSRSPDEIAKLIWDRLSILRSDMTGHSGIAPCESLDTNPLSPISELPVKRFNSAAVSSFVETLKNFVVLDQIPESGGWALSQEKIFEHNYGYRPSDIEKREGGIISTYIAVRALRVAGIPMNSYTAPGKAAAAYLAKRQTADGAFGRFTRSRSGEEIKPSFRHTALACLVLMTLEGPPSAILSGIQHLRTMTVNDLRDDAAPSIASAVSLLAMQCASWGAWGQQYFQPEDLEKNRRWLSERTREFILYVQSEAKSPTQRYAPLWEPYGHSCEMVFDSALTVIDFLTLLSDAPWDAITTGLSHIARSKVEHGLPYRPGLSDPDIGISTYFATICRRPAVVNYLQGTKDGRQILTIADECLAFCFEKWGKAPYMERTYCDTVANGLLLKLKCS